MSTIEGGAICTDDDELAEMLQIVRANGWDRNLTAAQKKKWRKKFDIHDEVQAKLIDNDFVWAAANKDRIVAEWKKRYDGKTEPKN